MNFKDLNKIIVMGESNQFNGVTLELFKKVKDGIKSHRICNVYGKNGTGKTTISKAISIKSNESTAKFDNFEGIELVQEENHRVYVYNEEFIDGSIKINSAGIKTIVMFGKQKDLDDKIIMLKEEQKIKLKELEQKNQELVKYNDEKNLLSPLKYQKQISNILKDKDGWANRDKDIKGNVRATTIPNNICTDIANIKEENTREQALRGKFDTLLGIYNKIDDKSTEITTELIKLNSFEMLHEEIEQLLRKKIDEPELTGRENKILTKIQDEGIKFYEDVKLEFSSIRDDICPYCLQKVSISYKEELIKSINNLLNEEVERHKD